MLGMEEEGLEGGRGEGDQKSLRKDNLFSTPPSFPLTSSFNNENSNI